MESLRQQSHISSSSLSSRIWSASGLDGVGNVRIGVYITTLIPFHDQFLLAIEIDFGMGSESPFVVECIADCSLRRTELER
jgi:hypothetical protein